VGLKIVRSATSASIMASATQPPRARPIEAGVRPIESNAEGIAISMKTSTLPSRGRARYNCSRRTKSKRRHEPDRGKSLVNEGMESISNITSILSVFRGFSMSFPSNPAKSHYTGGRRDLHYLQIV
jgi:hypothetical protein